MLKSAIMCCEVTLLLIAVNYCVLFVVFLFILLFQLFSETHSGAGTTQRTSLSR